MPVSWSRLVLSVTGISIPTTLLAVPFEPVIDMHVHGSMATRDRPVAGCPGDQPIEMLAVDPLRASRDTPTTRCPRPIRSVTNVDQLRVQTIEEFKRLGVVRAVVIGATTDIDRWSREAPGMVVRADAPDSDSQAGFADPHKFVADNRVEILAELGAQYGGFRTDDPLFDRLWAVAEENDVPVGIHLGAGSPLVGRDMAAPYRAALTSPFQLESTLKKHPKLRLYVMHAASPLIDEMIAMLFTYPTLYVDVGANVWNMPRAQFYSELKRLVDAGLSKRIMFGSDQTLFPQAIGIGIETIKAAPFLTSQQKRDILYNNAARFLRLTPAQIATDHTPRK